MLGIKQQLQHKGGEDVSSFVTMWPGTLNHSKWRTGCLGWTQHGPRRAHNKLWRRAVCVKMLTSKIGYRTYSHRIWEVHNTKNTRTRRIFLVCSSNCVENEIHLLTKCSNYDMLKYTLFTKARKFVCKLWQSATQRTIQYVTKGH